MLSRISCVLVEIPVAQLTSRSQNQEQALRTFAYISDVQVPSSEQFVWIEYHSASGGKKLERISVSDFQRVRSHQRDVDQICRVVSP